VVYHSYFFKSNSDMIPIGNKISQIHNKPDLSSVDQKRLVDKESWCLKCWCRWWSFCYNSNTILHCSSQPV